jgi:excisionase family DNA binding protein
VTNLDDALARAVADAMTHTLPTVVDRLVEVGGPRAYSVVQVADRLGLSESTVRQLIRDGHLATVPHLNPIRIAASTLGDFFSAQA